MLQIGFPAPEFKTRNNGLYEEIFDPVRKKWIKLTPEEWVRQNFLQFLIKVVRYPSSLIAIEKEIKIGELRKRFDMVVFDRNSLPWMLIECKSMDVPLTENVLSQALAYKSQMPCVYMIISNGHFTYGWQINEEGISALEVFPGYME